MGKNKNIYKTIRQVAALVMLSFVCYSCNKTFDKLPESVLDKTQVYRDVNDADAAIIGIYGQVMGIADKYIILNELRGDLMDVTPNADKYLNEINTESVSQDNPYSDPRPFYTIIMNCNDALANFKLMVKDNRMTQADFDLRYSAVGGIRSWLYLQLGIQFGSIPYITSSLDNVNDIKNQANYPRLSFDQLLDSLTQFTESLPYQTPFPAGTSLLTTVDGYATDKFFLPIKCLLGDLYLWKGDYVQAAANYHYMMNYADILYPAMNSEQWYETYKIAYTGNINGANWSNIFTQPYGERYSNYEIMWDLPFDQSFSPKNPFIKLFYNSAGGYLLKPSQLAINNWTAQTRNDNTPGDFRGNGASYKIVGGQPIINKFVSNYSPLLPFATNDKWILYRAATLHFHFAEAAIRAGQTELAYGFLNWGLKYTLDPEHLGTAHDSRDVTNIEQSFGAPFDFDARQGDFPSFRSPWYRNNGINGRVSLPLEIIDSSKYYDTTSLPRQFLNASSQDSLELNMENYLVNSSALELAFEGDRWPDLLRIALRREKEQPGSGVAFLQAKISAKFIAAGEPGLAATVSAKLAEPKNWFLKFDWN
ncbi:RagB/SusD family nutrient uptake outer membrane protein [Arachidicoccus soli]|uniref:RagB/SusD family protein n=1 Tax=Arachidicoccus soli TaxID=2341117 RepID=A0A386HQS1_9BACT|nr:RagB/SusD family nutrient uptake outer membrane protein [Arachidicoccus soli]AYD48287.1 RagB/SusD family protein [Arachidicoccus soli]